MPDTTGPSQRELSEKANAQIQDAGKWLVGAFAAVGAALIAGSQLSSIGHLTVCAHLTIECTRLWWALFGAAVGIAGVIWAIWTAVGFLIPERLPTSKLREEW